MAKATVQAALGPVILKRWMEKPENTVGREEGMEHAELIMVVCILSIVVTAPIGAVLISLTGPKLLTKTKPLPQSDGKFKFYCISNVKITKTNTFLFDVNIVFV